MYFALTTKTTKDNKVASSQIELSSLHSNRIKLKKKKRKMTFICLSIFLFSFVLETDFSGICFAGDHIEEINLTLSRGTK